MKFVALKTVLLVPARSETQICLPAFKLATNYLLVAREYNAYHHQFVFSPVTRFSHSDSDSDSESESEQANDACVVQLVCRQQGIIINMTFDI